MSMWLRDDVETSKHRRKTEVRKTFISALQLDVVSTSMTDVKMFAGKHIGLHSPLTKGSEAILLKTTGTYKDAQTKHTLKQLHTCTQSQAYTQLHTHTHTHTHTHNKWGGDLVSHCVYQGVGAIIVWCMCSLIISDYLWDRVTVHTEHI